MICRNCGSEIRENAKFCPRCGKETGKQISQSFKAADMDISSVWPEWKITQRLGKGSYGTVYKIVRNDNGIETDAALKIISIPSDEAEIDSLRSEGFDMDSTRDYFRNIVNDFIGEIRLMESFKGMQNIVSVEDYKVVEKNDGIGWDIYIRMELLTPFTSYISDKILTESEVIKLSCDICSALDICARSNVIHRDIKPENIFVNKFGFFKLGDFGIARELENVTGALSHKGTLNYIAPEVAMGLEYDARVDIYSLGIVLYRLLNGNRLPFLNDDEQSKNPNTRKDAVEKRIRGERLPAPCDASPEMADLILRACAFDRNERFSSAREMKAALMSIENHSYTQDKTVETVKTETDSGRYDRTVSVRRAPSDRIQNTAGVSDTDYAERQKPGESVKKKRAISFVHICWAIVIVLVMLIFLCVVSYDFRAFVLYVLRYGINILRKIKNVILN
ncbi:MAG: protein kinase [Clostridia bacterium]|nr:protein kinase [Clostridia bacterium]